ncbi:hypothetical protein [Streptomyces thermoviolaceus]|uniref:hypothetical protein n=1 Tax=Streptomyces thermoviolaceus TaxID=1952 RepID=UPI0016758433|nr:hypothetical protein [Streptomyces thermoviolaceus]WTD47715.1 hypothetical protein OG899_09380 [Streptomyces thermoviolaceus]
MRDARAAPAVLGQQLDDAQRPGGQGESAGGEKNLAGPGVEPRTAVSAVGC